MYIVNGVVKQQTYPVGHHIAWPGIGDPKKTQRTQAVGDICKIWGLMSHHMNGIYKISYEFLRGRVDGRLMGDEWEIQKLKVLHCCCCCCCTPVKCLLIYEYEFLE